VADARLAAGAAGLDGTAAGAAYRVVDFPALRLRDPSAPLGGNTTVHLPARELGRGTLDGPVAAGVPAGTAAFSFRVLPVGGDGDGDGDGWSMPWTGASDVEFGRPVDLRQTPLAEDGWTGPGEAALVPSGPLAQAPLAGREIPAGAFRVVLHGGNVTLGETQVATGPSAEASSGDPDGGEVLHDVVVFVEGPFSSLRPTGDGWLASLRGLEAPFRGDAELRDVDADLHVAGKAVTGPHALVQVQGAGTLRLAAPAAPAGSTGSADGDGRSAWTVRADATFVGVDGQTFSGRRDYTVPAVAATATAALLAAAWATHAGREALTFLTGFNVAQPLESEARVQMLRTIGAQPGITRMQLAGALDLSRTAVVHHLRVLERARLVDPRGEGKIPGYFLNHASFRFVPADAPPGPLVADRLVHLGHPLRRRILAELDGGPATLDDLRVRLEGLPASTLAYHVRLLEKGGLVERVRDGPRSLVRACLDMAAIRRHQVHALLTVEGLRPAMEALLGGGAPPTRGALERLHAYGLADRGADGAYVAAPWVKDTLRSRPL
jgi:DNA-binding transcriptional ArsR family regulator